MHLIHEHMHVAEPAIQSGRTIFLHHLVHGIAVTGKGMHACDKDAVFKPFVLAHLINKAAQLAEVGPGSCDEKQFFLSHRSLPMSVVHPFLRL
ncbi:hypothetical protein DSECCO2_388140 [anaerobic digester metagenome]